MNSINSQPPTPEQVREAMRGEGRQLLRPSRGLFQSDVYLVNVGSHSVVVKDFRLRPWWSRKFVCRVLLGREMQILREFADTGKVPALYGLVGKDAFAMEFLQGAEHPNRKKSGGNYHDAYQQAQQLLTTFHARGYAHNDFRRNNVMVMPDGSIRFIDFASALRKPQSKIKPLRWLLFPYTGMINYMQGADRNSLLKMRRDFTGEALSDAEREQIQKPAVVRFLQYLWNEGINKPLLRRFK